MRAAACAHSRRLRHRLRRLCLRSACAPLIDRQLSMLLRHEDVVGRVDARVNHSTATGRVAGTVGGRAAATRVRGARRLAAQMKGDIAAADRTTSRSRTRASRRAAIGRASAGIASRGLRLRTRQQRRANDPRITRHDRLGERAALASANLHTEKERRGATTGAVRECVKSNMDSPACMHALRSCLIVLSH